MSHMSELAECREAMREPRRDSDWFRALQGGLVEAVEETPRLDELGKRPGKAERDWEETIYLSLLKHRAYDSLALEEPDQIETCPYCGSGIFEDGDGEPRCAGCMETVSLDVELVAPEIVSIPVTLDQPEILDLSNDPLIMGILAGDIRTLCLDCEERDCPAHPVNGIV